MSIFRSRVSLIVLCLTCWLGLVVNARQTSAQNSDILQALIVDGQNNHADWPKTTAMMKAYLEASKRFRVDVARTQYTWNGKKWLAEYGLTDGKSYQDLPQPKPDPEFAPSFHNYDVVISNFGFNAAPWPDETRANFEAYVRDGGGFVVIHAANNSFGDWTEFNRMIGLGGWGGRNEQSGPRVYLDQALEEVRDTSAGNAGGHGPQHEFKIVIRDPNHPVTKGLPRTWQHAKDELYHDLRGPAEQMKILATAYSSPDRAGTGRHEPMMMVVTYGNGRIYHTPMGHADYSMECVGFITTLLRGTEWAATGDVTLTEVPEDFPGENGSSQRRFSN